MKPVNQIEFWKQRIDTARKEHFSVYVINDSGWDEINKRHKKQLKQFIPQEANVLDAGCGYGRWSELFENYQGVDFSPDFIEKARKKYPDKQFLVANLKKLPFKDLAFDVSFCVSIKKMIVDNLGEVEWKEMEKELLRVSKKILILEYEHEKIEII